MRDRLEGALSDRYAIDRELGRGGMATVWLARDRRHDRPVAIKVLHPELASAIGVDRFAREVRVTARLQHPGIIPVLDSGVLPADGSSGPLPWYAMAYVSGESLRARLEREVQLPVDEALHIAGEVAAALEIAHTQGIVHRDIKPENVLLAGTRVYVADFGIAKALADTGDDRLTGTGLALGTAGYMSPEQATGAPVDARSDQYSLAAMLYEMLAGEPPFTGPNAQTIIARRLTETPRSIRPVRPAVPESVERAVLRGLERIPADRFSDVSAFRTALQATSTPTEPVRVSAGRRKPLLVAATLLGIAGVAGWIAFDRQAKPEISRADPEIVRLYQRGMHGYEQRSTVGTIDAIQSFKGAIARDSNNALAWAGLAKTYVQVVIRQFQIPDINSDSTLRLAVAAIDRALALDTTDAEVWVARTIVTRRIDATDVRPSILAARKAIALDSMNGQAWHLLASGLAEQGDMAAALDAWREGVRRNPSYTLGLVFLGQGHYWHHQYDSAVVWADSSVAIDPNYLTGRVTVGQVEVERGNYARALAAFDAALRLSTDVESANALAGRALTQARMGRRREAQATLRAVDSIARMYRPTPLHTSVWVAGAYAAAGDANRALWWLEKYADHADLHYQIHVRCDAPLAVLRNDRRFRKLVADFPRSSC